MSYNNQDYYYKQAKKDGFRARSSYKLQQIQKKFHIIQRGDIVLDLGAAPGGWVQVASKIVGKKGKVIAIDRNPIRPFNEENVEVLQLDMQSPKLTNVLQEKLIKDVDVVLSDLAENTTGNWSLDSDRQIYLASMAFHTAVRFLRDNGNFITKIFRGPNIKEFEDEIKDSFSKIKHWRPPATRKKSAEEYIICKGYTEMRNEPEN
ncbi:MAG: RlmE family RNA methyltransferase [Candidatus Kariarchaeaceae archaeon]